MNAIMGEDIEETGDSLLMKRRRISTLPKMV